MLAEWEQQLVAASSDNADETSNTPTVRTELSEAEAEQLSQQEQKEREKEAALASQWQQDVSDKDEPATDTEPSVPESREPEQEEIDTGPPVKLTDSKLALSEMWDDLTEEPLPSDSELDAMFEEIRQLDQVTESEQQIAQPPYSDKPVEKDELKSILSSIPSFSQMNKKSDS